MYASTCAPAGQEGDFSLFNGPLITVNQRNGSTCFDQKFCGCSSDSVAATCNNSHLAIEAKAVEQTTFSEIPGVSSRGTSQQGC